MKTREWVLEKLEKEPGWGLTLGYLGLTITGLTYPWELLRRFGANVLDWAEFSNFAFAGIREPLVILLSLPAGLVVWWVGSRAKRQTQDLKWVTLEYNTDVPSTKSLWIGATSRAVLLYESTKKETIIVPQGSTVRIFLEPKTKGKR